jgi:hypothetical protein
MVNYGYKNDILDKFFAKMQESGIILLFIQEVPNDLIIPGFKRIAICNDARIVADVYERVGIYLLSGYTAAITDIKCIKQEPAQNNMGMVTRYANVCTINNIKFANIHLEGGRFCDEKLLGNFDLIMNHKINLLLKVLKEQPDVIMGDFNSVYSNDIQKYSEYIHEQYYDFESRKGTKLTNEEKRQIHMFNYGPYAILKKAGYTYVEPSNWKDCVTTVRGGTIVDTIWTKTTLVNESFIVNINTGDHMPIYFEITDKQIVTPQPESLTINEMVESHYAEIQSIGQPLLKIYDFNEAIKQLGRHEFNKASIKESGRHEFNKASIKESGRHEFNKASIKESGRHEFNKASIKESGRHEFNKAGIKESGRHEFNKASIQRQPILNETTEWRRNKNTQLKKDNDKLYVIPQKRDILRPNIIPQEHAMLRVQTAGDALATRDAKITKIQKEVIRLLSKYSYLKNDNVLFTSDYHNLNMILQNNTIIKNYERLIEDVERAEKYNPENKKIMVIEDTKYDDNSRDIETYIDENTNTQFFYDPDSKIEIKLHDSNASNEGSDKRYMTNFIVTTLLSYKPYGYSIRSNESKTRSYNTIKGMNASLLRYPINQDQYTGETDLNISKSIVRLRNYQLVVLNEIRKFIIEIYNKTLTVDIGIASIKQMHAEVTELFNKAVEMDYNTKYYYKLFNIYINRLVKQIVIEINALHDKTFDKHYDAENMKWYLYTLNDTNGYYINAHKFNKCGKECLKHITDYNTINDKINLFINYYIYYRGEFLDLYPNAYELFGVARKEDFMHKTQLIKLLCRCEIIAGIEYLLDDDIMTINKDTGELHINFDAEPIVSKESRYKNDIKNNKLCSNLPTQDKRTTVIALNDYYEQFIDTCMKNYSAAEYMFRNDLEESKFLLFLWSPFINKLVLQKAIEKYDEEKENIMFIEGIHPSKLKSTLLTLEHIVILFSDYTYRGIMTIHTNEKNNIKLFLFSSKKNNKNILIDEFGTTVRMGDVIEFIITDSELSIFHYEKFHMCGLNNEEQKYNMLSKKPCPANTQSKPILMPLLKVGGSNSAIKFKLIEDKTGDKIIMVDKIGTKYYDMCVKTNKKTYTYDQTIWAEMEYLLSKYSHIKPVSINIYLYKTLYKVDVSKKANILDQQNIIYYNMISNSSVHFWELNYTHALIKNNYEHIYEIHSADSVSNCMDIINKQIYPQNPKQMNSILLTYLATQPDIVKKNMDRQMNKIDYKNVNFINIDSLINLTKKLHEIKKIDFIYLSIIPLDLIIANNVRSNIKHLYYLFMVMSIIEKLSDDGTIMIQTSMIKNKIELKIVTIICLFFNSHKIVTTEYNNYKNPLYIYLVLQNKKHNNIELSAIQKYVMNLLEQEFKTLFINEKYLNDNITKQYYDNGTKIPNAEYINFNQKIIKKIVFKNNDINKKYREIKKNVIKFNKLYQINYIIGLEQVNQICDKYNNKTLTDEKINEIKKRNLFECLQWSKKYKLPLKDKQQYELFSTETKKEIFTDLVTYTPAKKLLLNDDILKIKTNININQNNTKDTYALPEIYIDALRQTTYESKAYKSRDLTKIKKIELKRTQYYDRLIKKISDEHNIKQKYITYDWLSILELFNNTDLILQLGTNLKIFDVTNSADNNATIKHATKHYIKTKTKIDFENITWIETHNNTDVENNRKKYSDNDLVINIKTITEKNASFLNIFCCTKNGGNAVLIRILPITSMEEISLLYIWFISFKKSYFYKPSTHDIKKEYYLVGIGYNKIDDKILDKMMVNLKNHDSLGINMDEISDEFLSKLNETQLSLIQSRNDIIRKKVYFLDNFAKMSKDDWVMLKQAIKRKLKDWLNISIY